ncbi:neurofilament protein H, form H2 [Colletotrichum truncatum]|uniref:Neurofilament protein H, form H2 n=1 Tax=Colletotrichum truncatum TaxID=5467 RepID=A0ACC3Z5D5_COLTU|nr:neurofilament protein H, form H2 [Colletotrichum truncatum]KAF6795174.1 neurofilament protein H, form H2 [Colletotrichum truncatum]
MATATTFSTDPALWIFTSLTAGSSHIVTATSRLETILRANRVPFKAIDIATDEKARMLWGRRAGKDASGRVRRLPGLIQEGLVLGDLTEIEEWNEYGELKQHVKIYYDEFTIPNIHNKPKIIKKVIKKKVPAAEGEASSSGPAPPAPPAAPPLPKNETYDATAKPPPSSDAKPAAGSSTALPVRSIADEAAAKAKQLRLQSLRDKVHGKKNEKAEEEKKVDDNKTEDTVAAAASTSAETSETQKKGEPSAQETARKSSVASTHSGSSTSKPAGLQSPTTGSWGASTTNPLALRETLQSPTTARWKPSDVEKPVTSHMGAQVASASQEEIAAIEKAEAIKEEPEKEESSEESSDEEEEDAPKPPIVKEVSQEKIAEVEKAQTIKEEPKKEAEEAEEAEEGDEDDSDEDDVNESEPAAKRPDAVKEAPKAIPKTEEKDVKEEAEKK